jgi:hypothetical protein
MFHNVAVTDDQSISQAFKKFTNWTASQTALNLKMSGRKIKKLCKMTWDVKATRRKARAKCPQFLRMFASAYATR